MFSVCKFKMRRVVSHCHFITSLNYKVFFALSFFFLCVKAVQANSAVTKDFSTENFPVNIGPLKDLNIIPTFYFDTRNYTTLNIESGLSTLPGGLNFWGFVDLLGNQESGNDRFDVDRYFLEYRLSKSLFSGNHSVLKDIRFEVEHNDSNGPDNDVLRLGLTYKHFLPFLPDSKSWLQWRYHPYETDGSGSQLSVIYYLKFTERIYINGFADLNLQNGSDDRWVAEPQINFVLNKIFDLVLETRYNGFEDTNKSLDGFGIAGGLKIKF